VKEGSLLEVMLILSKRRKEDIKRLWNITILLAGFDQIYIFRANDNRKKLNNSNPACYSAIIRDCLCRI
jgi:hypothetical protein